MLKVKEPSTKQAPVEHLGVSERANERTLASPSYPSLYQINTRVWLTDLSHKLGRPESWR